MPWKETKVLDSRMQFIALYLQQTMSFSELCRNFGISRTTGYKFIERYHNNGPAGLEDMPRIAYSHPNATACFVQEQIVALRSEHPNWGPRKLRAILIRQNPEQHWPAASTIGELLKSRGLVTSRRRKKSYATPSCSLTNPDAPNDVWTADFKGQFRLTNNLMCYPLTICDRYSRMLLKCQALPNTSIESAKPVWVATFREHGLPRIIRSDNGTPFASTGIGGLSRLSAWWIRLGIFPERTAPAHPQQNGSHENMHRALKADVAKAPQANLKLQQVSHDKFVNDYNYLRPHEALKMQVPADIYVSSPRPYPLILPELPYPDNYAIRQVRTNGDIKWRGKHIFLSEILTGEPVGICQIDDRYFAIYYGPVPLAILDEHNKSLLASKDAAPHLKQLMKEAREDIHKC
jgi:transposase InsO family protein